MLMDWQLSCLAIFTKSVQLLKEVREELGTTDSSLSEHRDWHNSSGHMDSLLLIAIHGYRSGFLLHGRGIPGVTGTLSQHIGLHSATRRIFYPLPGVQGGENLLDRGALSIRLCSSKSQVSPALPELGQGIAQTVQLASFEQRVFEVLA